MVFTIFVRTIQMYNSSVQFLNRSCFGPKFTRRVAFNQKWIWIEFESDQNTIGQGSTDFLRLVSGWNGFPIVNPELTERFLALDNSI